MGKDRCEARSQVSGTQCDQVAGHDGKHSKLPPGGGFVHAWDDPEELRTTLTSYSVNGTEVYVRLCKSIEDRPDPVHEANRCYVYTGDAHADTLWMCVPYGGGLVWSKELNDELWGRCRESAAVHWPDVPRWADPGTKLDRGASVPMHPEPRAEQAGDKVTLGVETLYRLAGALGYLSRPTDFDALIRDVSLVVRRARCEPHADSDERIVGLKELEALAAKLGVPSEGINFNGLLELAASNLARLKALELEEKDLGSARANRLADTCGHLRAERNRCHSENYQLRQDVRRLELRLAEAKR